MPLAFRILTMSMQHDKELKHLLEKCGMTDKTCYLIEGEVAEGQPARILQTEDNAPYPGTTIEESAQNHIDALMNPPEAAGTTAVMLPSDGRYFLNSAGTTYHLPTCAKAQAGSFKTLDQIAESKPDAKPCATCNPPALPFAGGEDGAE